MRSRCTNPASAAKLFVQLSRSCAQQQSSQRAPLDILLPASARSFHVAARSYAPITSRSSASLSSSLPRRTTACAASTSTATTARSFSSTSARQMTQAIYNPQKDDDGNEMVMEITPRAANRLSQIMEKDKNPYLALRIQVESGGCHGFQYLMSLTTLPSSLNSGTSANPDAMPPSQEVTAEAGENSTTTDTTASEPGVGEEDTVFAFVKEGEGSLPANTTDVDALAAGPKIVLDAPSLELLKGSKVDYTMELIGSQFKIVDNPLASSSCGCGTSFDIKI
ncbi:Iron-sulfur cluster assembly 2-like protein- mitochondrial [Apiospora rasikravindrae]|uniref:Iron-sulfur cluster assembly 2-like protein-mitochondrial n=1 Tax=Apiospora rasikravindrae TaxID=990691 RepID=A0ABR1RVV2_9PEZI